MFGRKRYAVVVLAALGLSLSASPARSAAPADAAPAPRPSATDPARLRAEGEKAERRGEWDRALDFYLRAVVAGLPTSELRDRIRTCLRNANQHRRHRDAAFQQFVLSLPVADALHLYAEAVGKLSTLYADRDRAAPARLFELGLDELDRALADPTFREQHLVAPADTRVASFQRSLRDDWRQRLPVNPREARHAARELVAEAQAAVGVRTPSAIVFELLCGACTGLDEYTVYVTPTAAQAELASPIVELAGYGILIRFADDRLVVDGLVPGSWAALHTGLRKGDRITRVNGREPVAGNPAALAEAVRAFGMLGHELEVVASDPAEVPTLVHLPVPVPTVYGVETVSTPNGVGYLRVGAFRESTPRELDEWVYHLKGHPAGLRVLILDFRGNTGGLFTAGIEVAQRFLPAGIIVTTQGQSPEFADRVFSSDSGLSAFDIPVVLLIDTRTMSAAEAVAAAWKDHERAILVGLPTFGKGVVQSPIRLTAADGPGGQQSGVLILTVASMFGPRGGPINGAGVAPHVLESDPNRQLDLAISKAVELLTSGR
jgi:carboxyl-terminal processing protease